MASNSSDTTGLSLRFGVLVDGMDLAPFTGCTGLGAEYEKFEWQEGGNNSYVTTLPGKLTYTPVRLTRPVDKHSAKIASWFAEQAILPVTKSVVIKLFDANYGAGSPIATWTLDGAWPLQYTGPVLATGPEGDTVAIETLVLVHQGFTS
jgi:phage tail-like protein